MVLSGKGAVAGNRGRLRLKGRKSMAGMLVSFALTALLAGGCNILNPGSGSGGTTMPLFSIADTNGIPTTTFHSGESFDLSFAMVNTTNDTLVYYGSPGPAVVFRVMKGDSVVATSVDGYLFPQVVIARSLAPGDTLRGFWRAPTTPAQVNRVALAPGGYTADVSYPVFDKMPLERPSPIPFLVVR